MTEKVLCAAIHFDDEREHVHQPHNIKTGYVMTGHRHHNCYATLTAVFTDLNNEPWKRVRCDNEVQGFITNKFNFLTREEAFILAMEQNQIKDLDNTRGDKLFSEDLY